MSRTHRGPLSGLVVIALLLLAGYIMLADFLNLRHAREASEETPVALAELALPQPWGGYGWRALARLAGDASRIDPATAQRVLTDAGRRYPLDAVQWLDLARIHARDDEAQPVDLYLARAGAVQPHERRTLWAAAQVALQTGNAQLAERQLRQWLRLYPRDTGQALFIGQRWIDDPGTLLDRMLPPGREYLAEAMDVARRQTDVQLAEAVWARLTPKPGLDDSLFLNFVELMLQTGDVTRAVELWAERDPRYEPTPRLSGVPSSEVETSEVETSEVQSARTEPSEFQSEESDAAERRLEARSSETESGSRSAGARAENPRMEDPRAFLLVNGDFSRPLGEPLALNWRINRLPPGVRAEMDSGEAFSGPASLRLEFNGKENVHLAEPWIRIPVVPGQHYRLSGAWRAEALSTRSLPYWSLTAEQGDLRQRKAVPGAKFGWERWQIEFQAPEETQLVRLQLRRDRTNAFDRNIDGTLWLDDFRLEPIAEPRSLQSAASEALGREASVKGTVSGFRVPVSGENPPPDEPATGVGAGPAGDDGATDSGQISVGAGSGRDERGQETQSLARQAPTTVDGSDPTEDSSPALEFATGVGAGPAGDDGATDSGQISVGAGSGRDESVQDAPPTTTNNQQPTTPLNFRQPETGNPKPVQAAR